jgi:4a-hydroxytetrahydrobiopterin dehydratase
VRCAVGAAYQRRNAGRETRFMRSARHGSDCWYAVGAVAARPALPGGGFHPSPFRVFSRDRGRCWCQELAMAKLSPALVKKALGGVSKWSKKGSAIRRTYEFKDFPPAIKFVNAVAKLAEKAGHHPDIDIRWNKVTLALTTHDEGGLTQKDFDLAAKLDRVT